ncbi:hypothetical protein HLB23_17535 [Nocardia uniformis]|uniref:Uncharacterized protein n=1 Tax=Nocardia uniformis TaxID=53432 RepID=A0A849C5N2_9NOCA|nr:hypothetical protein [Nocardia uniformis]NNH71645.1 hypothetical protein [Nocardia uniformis]
MSYSSHDVPGYPVENIEQARRGRYLHDECSDDCDAKRYYTALVPQLEHRSGLRGRNIWTGQR